MGCGKSKLHRVAFSVHLNDLNGDVTCQQNP